MVWNEKDERCFIEGVVPLLKRLFRARYPLLWDSGGDLAEVAGPAGPLLRTRGTVR